MLGSVHYISGSRRLAVRDPLAALLFLLAPAAPVHAAPLFTAPYMSFDTGPYPYSVAVSDLNGDGWLDLVAVNYVSNTVSVLLGNGDGTFKPRTDFGTGPQPRSVAIADLEADGRPDLAVAGADSVSVMLGNGDGTFGAPTGLATGYSRAVAIGDLNADGRLDLAVGATPGVAVLLDNGDGTFGAATLLIASSLPTAVAITDLNADGRPDLAVTGNWNADPDDPAGHFVSVLLGNGDGTFGEPVDYRAGVQPVSVAIGDLDRDGAPDLAVASNHYSWSRVAVLRGNGDGTFGLVAYFQTASGPWSVVVADFNLDGRLDLATANSDGDPDFYQPSVSLLLGNGDGTFAPRIDMPAGENPQALAVADLNADGRVDLAVANGSARMVSVLLGNGDATFGTTASFDAGDGEALAIADLNADGHVDVATATSVLLGRGDGTFGTWIGLDAGSGPRAVGIGDLNADGRPDLAMANDLSASVSVLLGNGDGTFGARAEYATGINPYALAIADLNADGRLDLAAANHGSGSVSVLLGNGDGTLGPKTDFGTGGGPQRVAISDLKTLVGGDEWTGLVTVLLGNGDGSFGNGIRFGCGAEPQAVAVADLNEDGRPDLAVANLYAQTVSVLLGTGDLPTPVQVSLASVEATPERVVLRWRGEGVGSLAASIHRRGTAEEWRHLGSPVAEGADVLRYEDRAVTAGDRYTYRLGYRDGAAEWFTPEIEVDVPAGFRLALEGFLPNPASGAPVLAFSLGDNAPATIEVIDVAGRRVLQREVGGLGAGHHTIGLAEGARLAPGVYLVRLRQAGRVEVARGVVIR